MARDDHRLEGVVERMLEDPLYAEHPLRQALSRLYVEYRDSLYQLERITRFSDGYQSAGLEEKLSLSDRYRRQLRQLERLTRISNLYQSMMRDLNEALKVASTTDALTGIANRRMLMERLTAETARAERQEQPLTLVIVDVDHFKAVNDTHGHEAGDKLLVEISRVIESGVRGYDLCGRWGGEEFLIIMPGIGAADCARVIDRIRCAIGNLLVRVGDTLIETSASFGLAERLRGETVSETISRADAALYCAKRAGRNRYHITD